MFTQMTKIDKLIEKYKNAPQSLSIVQILKILDSKGLEIIEGKGSHVICKHENNIFMVVPIHSNDCKDFYKKQILTKLVKLKLI